MWVRAAKELSPFAPLWLPASWMAGSRPSEASNSFDVHLGVRCFHALQNRAWQTPHVSVRRLLAWVIPVLPPAYGKSYKRYPCFSNRKPLFAAGCFSFGIPIRSARLHSSDMAELGSRLISELSKRRSG
jgi:hypothetical protein